MRVPKRHSRYVARAGLRNPAAFSLLLAACGSPAALSPAPAIDAPRREVVHYQLFFGDQPIGFASERLRENEDGFVLIREERIRARRNGQSVDSTTVVRISGASMSAPNRIEWTAASGGRTRTGLATRSDIGWDIAIAGESRREIKGGAIPWELIAWLKQPEADAAILFPGLGFVPGRLTPSRTGDTLRLVVRTPAGTLTTDVTIDGKGRWRQVQSGAVVAVRVASPAALPARGPELIVDTSIPYRGTPSRTLILDNVERPLPATFAGQSVRAESKRWVVEFKKTPAPSRDLEPILAGELMALASQAKLTTASPQHFGGPGPTTGDCTAHAVAFVEALARRGIRSTIVTGFRADDGKLYRHRWVEVEDGDHRVAVDPVHGLASLPPGRYLALGRHGGAFSDVALSDEITFAGTQRASAIFR
jgi:hypothetical protein